MSVLWPVCLDSLRRSSSVSARFFGSLFTASRYVSTESVKDTEKSSKRPKSIEELFVSKDVQRILSNLTGRDVGKIFSWRQVDKIGTSVIKLMTEEELRQARETKLQEVEWHLQMPPVMAERTPCEETIVEDNLLQKYADFRHVFIDITYGVKPRERTILVRELNGTLRTATWEERDKMNQIYFPIEGRDIDIPAVFLEEKLNDALARGFEEYILNRACVQFEPDDPHFLRVCHTVYQSINEKGSFKEFESTRHLGGLVFYLAQHKTLNNYLIYLLENDRLSAVGDALRLNYILHPEGAAQFSSIMSSDANQDEAVIAVFKYYLDGLDINSRQKGSLELAFQAFQENARQRTRNNSIDDQKMSAKMR